MKQILPLKFTKPLAAVASRSRQYRVMLFIVIVAAIYGYIGLTISTLSHAEPTSDQIGSQNSPIHTTKIDPKVIEQLQQLQDNSISVKALFNETRDNPFQEN